LTGAGSVFSAGVDVQETAAEAEDRARRLHETRAWYRQGIQRIPRAIYGLEVPLIAAVNGPAIGAGCDLACMCDLRIAAASAVFAASFAHVGLIPGDGGAYFLSRVVGYTRAAEMIFTAKRVDAELALSYGLVSRVTADERLLDEALALAGQIAAHPPPVLRMGKWLLREAQALSLDTVLELSANMQAIAHATPAHREAVAALVQKLSQG
jgi:enoyl-CoA hydratase/carnithine racemase